MLVRTPIHSPIQSRRSFLADICVFLGIGAIIYATFRFAGQWDAQYNPTYDIDLSLSALPLYALFSALRGLVAYAISLLFTFAVGYWAAHSPSAEKVIIPMLDVFQSIPVLGFLPGLVLGLVALFPNTNMGLELAAILMIFTGQVWNMTFAFYSSLKAVPGDLREASTIMGLSKSARFLTLELPFASVNLVWNSIMSMAGGWFFLTVCEAFTLGTTQYRLPGLGSYMAVAIEKSDTSAMIAGVLAMAFVIIVMDLLIWRPALAWVHRYRIEADAQGVVEDRLLRFIFAHSSVLRLFKKIAVYRKQRKLFRVRPVPFHLNLKFGFKLPRFQARWLGWPLFIGILIVMSLASFKLVTTLASVALDQWWLILQGTFFTFLRVVGSLLISTLWALPAGIWLSRGNRRLRIAQPIAQLLASFPAPMLYPLVLSITFGVGLAFSWSSMILMLLGVQWYVLFNTLAGGLRISKEIDDSMSLIGSSKKDKWRYLYFPSVFPSLVTGWVTAAGGAWNASIVAEYLSFNGQTLQTNGLGALISISAAKENFPMLAACLVVMVVFVILLNRYVWDKIYHISQTRFRLDF
jgi:NitT/TauT family transport system permease protein